MKTDELLQEAEKCLIGDCFECKHSDGYVSCRDNLISDLAHKLKMAIADIAVNCSTCMYKGKSYKEPPCSLCTPLEFNKWQWKGDSE